MSHVKIIQQAVSFCDTSISEMFLKGVAFFMGFMMPLMVFETLFKYLLVFSFFVGLISIIIKRHGFHRVSILPFILLFSYSITTLISINYPYPELLKVNGVAYLLQFGLITGIFYFWVSSWNHEDYSAFTTGLKCGVFLDICWACAQLVMFYLFGIDVNQTVFVETFMLRTNASFFYNGRLCATGLAWHPICMAIVLVIASFLFKKIAMHVVIVFLSFMTLNSTVLIGVCAAYGLRAGRMIRQVCKGRRISKRGIVLGCALAGILLLTPFLFPDLIQMAASSIQRVINRILYESVNSRASSMSGYVHFRYYTSLPHLYNMFDWFQRLFGSGLDSSGYWFTLLYGQYETLVSWIAESDFINVLLGSGLSGCLFFYGFLLKVIINGRGDSTWILVTTLFIMGFFYNVQYIWVILLEMIMLGSSSSGYPFFDFKHKISEITHEEHTLVFNEVKPYPNAASAECAKRYASLSVHSIA